MHKTAQRTNEPLWQRIVQQVTAGDKGGRAGEWSARKAQLAVALYKEAGGGYIGHKDSDNSLVKWTQEKWRTKSGQPSLRTGERYLPEAALDALTPHEYGATTRAKREGMKYGQQFVPQPSRIAAKVAPYRTTNGYPSALRWSVTVGDLWHGGPPSTVTDESPSALVEYLRTLDIPADRSRGAVSHINGVMAMPSSRRAAVLLGKRDGEVVYLSASYAPYPIADLWEEAVDADDLFGGSHRVENREVRSVPKAELVGKRVKVYYNLANFRWSVMSEGKVVLHTDYIALSDVVFYINESGRQRVLREQKKDVHAYAIGVVQDFSLSEAEVPAPEYTTELTYNPFKYDSFVVKSTEQPVTKAAFVQMIKRKVYATGVVYAASVSSPVTARAANPRRGSALEWGVTVADAYGGAPIELFDDGLGERLIRFLHSHDAPTDNITAAGDYLTEAIHSQSRAAVLVGKRDGKAIYVTVRRLAVPRWTLADLWDDAVDAGDLYGGTHRVPNREVRTIPKAELVGKKAEVWFNLHNFMWSVRTGGKVVLHTDYIELADVVFRINEGGRQRVLRDREKNVHAFAVGTVLDYSLSPDDAPLTADPAFNTEVTYNPYKYDSFVVKATEEPVMKAAFVQMIKRKVYATGVVYAAVAARAANHGGGGIGGLVSGYGINTMTLDPQDFTMERSPSRYSLSRHSPSRHSPSRHR